MRSSTKKSDMKYDCMHAPSIGVSRSLADDNKPFTTALYGNGPGHKIVNGSRAYVNATMSGMFRCAVELFRFS